MAFKKTKQEALDLLQEKEKRLAELTEESAYAVQMVQNTIDNLQAVTVTSRPRWMKSIHICSG